MVALPPSNMRDLVNFRIIAKVGITIRTFLLDEGGELRSNYSFSWGERVLRSRLVGAAPPLSVMQQK